MPIAVTRAPAVITPPPPSIFTARDRWLWISPHGVVRELTAFVNGAEILRGMFGRFAPPVEATRDVIPELAGTRLRAIRHGLREIDVPIVVIADSYSDLHDLLAQMSRELNPLLGEGILRRVSRSGREYDLFCRCTAGFGIDGGEGSLGPAAQTTTLVFEADDPYWYGEFQTQSWKAAIDGAWFPPASPTHLGVFPHHLAHSAVFGSATVNNVGDATAWPIWTIHGPGTRLELVNKTTGKTIEVTHTLNTGEVLVINTTPGVKTLVGPGNANWRQYLTGRSLWGLEPQLNALDINLDGASSSSYVTIGYRPRLLAPSVGVAA